MQHIFLTNRNGLDRSRKTRSKLRKKSSNTSWKNCHKPVGLLICQISQVPNKFHKPLASDLWLNSQTAVVVWNYCKSCNQLCTSHPLAVLQPWNFFKPMLKTTITFIFIFSFVCLGGNIFLLPFYPRFSVWGERYWPSSHYWIFVLDRTR